MNALDTLDILTRQSQNTSTRDAAWETLCSADFLTELVSCGEETTKAALVDALHFLQDAPEQNVLDQGAYDTATLDLAAPDDDWAEHVLAFCEEAEEKSLFWAAAIGEQAVLDAFECSKAKREEGLCALDLLLRNSAVWESIDACDARRKKALDDGEAVEPVLAPQPEDEYFMPDVERMAAYRALAQRAQAGDMTSCEALLDAMFVRRDEWPAASRADSSTAVGYTLLLAQMGDASMQTRIGTWLVQGDKGLKSSPAAERWLLLAREGGDDSGQHLLAILRNL